MVRRLVSVAVPVPALDLLTYSLPDALTLPPRGARVVVPLGRRTLTGVAMGGQCRQRRMWSCATSSRCSTSIRFFTDVVELAEWVADYYLAGPGATLSAAMPPHALTSRVDAFRTRRTVSRPAEGHDLAGRIAVGPRCSPGELPRALGSRQSEVLLVLRGAPDGLSVSELAERGISSAVLSRLRSMGLVTARRERVERDPFASGQAVAGESLDTPRGS